MSITNWAIRHSVTIFVLVGVIVLVGYSSYMSMPREAAPDVDIPYIVVTVPYIGVSPEDIETLVTDPVEEELERLKDVEEITSISAESASMIFIEFEPGTDIDIALQLVRERVNVAKIEIPPEAEEPIITEISFVDWPIMLVNISGEIDLIHLKRLAEEVQDRIESVQGVLEVKLVGGLEREITVEADPDLLAFYRISLGELMQVIQLQNVNLPGGSVELGDLNYSVRVPGEFVSVAEIENLIVREMEGEPIYVRDVAEVIDGFEEQTTYSRLDERESVSLSITRRMGENVPLIASQVREIVREFEAESEGSVEFTVLADLSEEIEARVMELENNIITGLILVAIVLLFFMGGLRNALFVAIAIPLSMLITFIVLSSLGITLNMIVLFSLMLALGMMVDNAIVVVENIYRHANMGKSNVQAAMDAVKEVAWPVVASAATTMAAFFPLLFWPGIIGDFMSYLPLTIIIVLASSLFVALVINPVICSRFLKVKGDRNSGEVKDETESLPNNIIYRIYRWMLSFSLNHRWVVGLVVTATLFGTFSIYGRRNAGVEFFPETTPERAFVDVSLPEGANLDASDAVVRAVERAIYDEDNVEVFVADVGAGNSSGMSSGGNSSHQSRVTIDLLAVEDQVESAYDTLARIREETSGLVGAEISVVKEDMGPPSGAPINIEIVGEDYAALGELAQQVSYLIRGVDGVVNLSDDFEAGKPEITVNVDREAASLLGVNTTDVALTVRMAINGMTASVFREGDEEYDIVVRLPEAQRDSVEDIEQLSLLTRYGEQVFLSEVADVRVGPGLGSIRHIDRERVVTVSAEAAEGVNANALLTEVQGLLAESAEIPPGYELRYTGENEMQAESQQFLGKALLIALMLIAMILVTQFNSVLQPTIILISIILSLVGVLWALMLKQMPFNVIMTGLGIISLAGVVVNNSIVMIDYINQLKNRGLPTKRAVLTAGLVRLRPVMLTAMTAALSLMPIVLGFSLNARQGTITAGGNSVEFWGPMANAMVAGLISAIFLTLIVVPVAYSTLDSLKNLFSRRKSKAVVSPNLEDEEKALAQ